MPIFHEKKTIFSHNPKAGGTSVLDVVGINKSNRFNPMNVFGYVNVRAGNLIQDKYFDRHGELPTEHQNPTAQQIAKHYGFPSTPNVLAQHFTKIETIEFFEMCYGKGTLAGYDSFTTIRNPYDRWISSLGMIGIFDLGSIDKLVTKLSSRTTQMQGQWDFRIQAPVKSDVNYDLLTFCHTRPQHAWAEDVENIFTLDNAETLLTRYLREKGLIDEGKKIGRTNVRASQKYKDLKHLLLNLYPGRYDDFIKEFYAKDIKMYEETLEKERKLLGDQNA